MMKRLGFFVRIVSVWAVLALLAVVVGPAGAVSSEGGAGAPPGQVADVRYGPFTPTPAGAGGDLDHAHVAPPHVEKPGQDCFILGAQPDPVYQDGAPRNIDSRRLA